MLREMGGTGFVGRCFPVYPMDFGGSSTLFVLVWVSLSLEIPCSHLL